MNKDCFPLPIATGPCKAVPVVFLSTDIAGVDDTINPPANGAHFNTIVTYLKTKHVYIYDSAGIPTRTNYDGVIDEALDIESKNPVENRVVTQAIADTAEALQTNINLEVTAREQDRDNLQTNINKEVERAEKAETELVDAIHAESAAREEGDQNLQTKLDSVNDTSVQKDTTVSGDNSTVTITKTTGKLSEEGTEEAMPLPVASAESAGVMNPATFNAVQENAENIDAILGGAVVVEDLPASPTDAQLTTAWKTATGRTELINRASIYDETNKKVWYYYENVSAWKDISTDSTELSVSIATNDTAGIVKGSTEDGQIAVEADGSMSLNGYDAMKGNIDNLQSGLPKLPNSMVYDFVSPAGANNPSTADNANITARVVNTSTGDSTNATLMMPMASSTQAGSVTAADKSKLDTMLAIKSLDDSLSLNDDGELSVVGGGGGAVDILTSYLSTATNEQVYSAKYINSRLSGDSVNLGTKSTAASPYSSVAIGNNSYAQALYSMALGPGARTSTNSTVAIGHSAIVSHSRSVSLGGGSQTTRDSEVSIGGGNPSTRFLANVTDGELPQDAVTVHQLNEAVGDINTALQTLISGTGAQ